VPGSLLVPEITRESYFFVLIAVFTESVTWSTTFLVAVQA